MSVTDPVRVVVQTFFCTKCVCNVRLSPLNKQKKTKKTKNTRVIFKAVYMKQFLKFLFHFLSGFFYTTEWLRPIFVHAYMTRT
jgi:thiamine transporter ThiT